MKYFLGIIFGVVCVAALLVIDANRSGAPSPATDAPVDAAGAGMQRHVYAELGFTIAVPGYWHQLTRDEYRYHVLSAAAVDVNDQMDKILDSVVFSAVGEWPADGGAPMVSISSIDRTTLSAVDALRKLVEFQQQNIENVEILLPPETRAIAGYDAAVARLRDFVTDGVRLYDSTVTMWLIRTDAGTLLIQTEALDSDRAGTATVAAIVASVARPDS